MSELKGNNSTPKITDMLSSRQNQSPQATKRMSSQLSPMEDDQQNKKYNSNIGEIASSTSNFSQLLDPLLSQFKSLRESVDNKVGSLENTIQQQKKEVTEELHKIESNLSRHKEELNKQFKEDIQQSRESIQWIVNENISLKKENTELKERLSKIEQTQLKNNVIITSIPEQQWETYNTTKQRVLDTIASSMKGTTEEESKNNIEVSNNTKIAYCTRVDRYWPGRYRPISVTFQRQEDKDTLMSGKSNLPPGLYVNHEYPPLIKRNRDQLHPILRLAKSTQKYKDKCRLENDTLVLDGNRYSINDIPTLHKKWMMKKLHFMVSLVPLATSIRAHSLGNITTFTVQNNSSNTKKQSYQMTSLLQKQY